jgi:hypothetical protein
LPNNFKNPDAASASLLENPAVQNLKFERADWTSFRTVEGLQQKAGVATDKLIRLVLKELADNALDTGARVKVGQTRSGYFVEDDGRGIDGTPEEIARLFSIARPLVSTKQLRLPTRGALGNGLRVVAGSVLASDGSLVVITKGKRIALRPRRDGSTTVAGVKPSDQSGTRIEIGFGPAIPEDEDALDWAVRATQLARGETYQGRSSPWWYDGASFHELLEATGMVPVRELVASLDGCTGARAGEIVTEAKLNRLACAGLSREQSDRLLTIAREYAKPVTPKRLGTIGPSLFGFGSYAVSNGTRLFGAAEPFAQIPFVVEAWARRQDEMYLLMYVNRTPVTGNMDATREKRDIDFFGCGLHHNIATAPKDQNFYIWLNVTTPYMPITSDGKEPNLEPFLGTISDAVAKAVRKAQRPNTKGLTQKDVVLDNLDDAIATVSGEEGYRFNSRQLFYVLRPIVMDATGAELKIGNFTKILTDHEAENGEIPLMYREPRGSITHPHRDETITLGTLMVEEYERPVWTFNKLQAALHRERGRTGSVEAEPLAGATRLRRDVVEGVLDPRRPRPD